MHRNLVGKCVAITLYRGLLSNVLFLKYFCISIAVKTNVNYEIVGYIKINPWMKLTLICVGYFNCKCPLCNV